MAKSRFCRGAKLAVWLFFPCRRADQRQFGQDTRRPAAQESSQAQAVLDVAEAPLDCLLAQPIALAAFGRFHPRPQPIAMILEADQISLRERFWPVVRRLHLSRKSEVFSFGERLWADIPNFQWQPQPSTCPVLFFREHYIPRGVQ